MSTSITPTQAGLNIVSAYKEQELDQQSLTVALGNLKGMSAGEALMALLFIMGEHSMVIQQDQINIDAQNLNMMTSLGQIATKITNDFNGISPSNTVAPGNSPPWAPGSNNALAADLITQCNALKAALQNTTLSWTNPVTGAQEKLQWIDPTLASETSQGLASFMSSIGAGNGSLNNVSTVVSTITGWISNPTATPPGSGQTGQELRQAADSSLATLSNTFSGLAQSATNIIKEANTMLTQYQSALASLCTAYDTQDKAIVSNFKGG